MIPAVEKYLARHAEPEIQIIRGLRRSFGHVIVIPAFDETETLYRTLETIPKGLLGDVLTVLVVNARADSPPTVHSRSAQLIQELADRYGSESRRDVASVRCCAWIGPALGRFRIAKAWDWPERLAVTSRCGFRSKEQSGRPGFTPPMPMSSCPAITLNGLNLCLVVRRRPPVCIRFGTDASRRRPSWMPCTATRSSSAITYLAWPMRLLPTRSTRWEAPLRFTPRPMRWFAAFRVAWRARI